MLPFWAGVSQIELDDSCPWGPLRENQFRPGKQVGFETPRKSRLLPKQQLWSRDFFPENCSEDQKQYLRSQIPNRINSTVQKCGLLSMQAFESLDFFLNNCRKLWTSFHAMMINPKWIMKVGIKQEYNFLNSCRKLWTCLQFIPWVAAEAKWLPRMLRLHVPVPLRLHRFIYAWGAQGVLPMGVGGATSNWNYRLWRHYP